jgi:hypothetical protein
MRTTYIRVKQLGMRAPNATSVGYESNEYDTSESANQRFPVVSSNYANITHTVKNDLNTYLLLAESRLL